jgi:hypothetical protein
MATSIDSGTEEVFVAALRALTRARTRFLVAGAFAISHHCGIWRNTKDLDIFCEPEWARRILRILARSGFTTSIQERHSLGKAKRDGVLVDVIWGCGNWTAQVDEHWFAHAEVGNLFGVDVAVAPADDLILSKAWVAGRERYDGADI